LDAKEARVRAVFDELRPVLGVLEQHLRTLAAGLHRNSRLLLLAQDPVHRFVDAGTFSTAVSRLIRQPPAVVAP